MDKTLGRIFQISVFWYFFVPDVTSGWLGNLFQRLKKYGYDIERQFGFWRYQDLRAGGGDFFDHAPHYVDVMRFYDYEIEQVSCETRRCYPESRPYEDLAVATFKLSDDVVFLYDKTLSAPAGPSGLSGDTSTAKSGKIAFKAGHAYTGRGMKIGTYRIFNILHNLYYPVRIPAGKKNNLFYRQMRYFIDRIRGEETITHPVEGPWEATPEDSYLTIAWTLASYKSARDGIKITRENLFKEAKSFETGVPHDW